jgi:hypothetical protein
MTTVAAFYGTLTLEHTVFGNVAGDGGGIYNETTTTLQQHRHGSTAKSNGGGICVVRHLLANSTISNHR